MANDIPHDGAPFEVPIPLPATGVKDPMLDKANGTTGDIATDIAAEEIYPPEPELELLPLRVRPFGPTTYHPRTHAMAFSGMLRFEDFAPRHARGLSLARAYITSFEPLARVREMVNEAGFNIFCFGFSQLQVNRLLLGTLVERWWDTANSLHFFTTREITMTPYDFSMITGLRVRGDPIPFDLHMGQWPAA
ncbi:hypothetical protein ACSBR2_035656 [Camellia fascicularis]